MSWSQQSTNLEADVLFLLDMMNTEINSLWGMSITFYSISEAFSNQLKLSREKQNNKNKSF